MGSAAHARNLIGPVLTSIYRVRITGGHHLPRSGGVLILSAEKGILDPTILATSLTRPVRWLVDPSEQSYRLRPVTSALGRIDMDPARSPWHGLNEAVEALKHGEAVGVFIANASHSPRLSPPGAMAAYLHARTGAPIVPVTIFGSHGPRATDPPRPRARIDIHVGSLTQLSRPADPVSVSELRRHAEAIRHIHSDAHAEALSRTGRRPVDNPVPTGHQNDPRG